MRVDITTAQSQLCNFIQSHLLHSYTSRFMTLYVVHLEIRVHVYATTILQFLHPSLFQFPFLSCWGNIECQEQGFVCVWLTHGATPNTTNWHLLKYCIGALSGDVVCTCSCSSVFTVHAVCMCICQCMSKCEMWNCRYDAYFQKYCFTTVAVYRPNKPFLQK